MDSGMKKWEVRFADVEEFYLINVSSSKQIGIKYKKEVEFQKMNDASSAGRTFRKLNERLAGVQESLPADGLNNLQIYKRRMMPLGFAACLSKNFSCLSCV